VPRSTSGSSIQKFQTIVAQEEYVQVLRTYGLRSGDAQIEGEATHRVSVLKSDFALAGASRQRPTGFGFRDPFEVDGKPVRNRDARRSSVRCSTG